MTIHIRPYTTQDFLNWDEFCKTSLQSTLLHTRSFLDYHGSRFDDNSLIIEEEGRVVGLFPAARDLDDLSLVVSHPGVTYGGILHQGGLRGAKMIDALEALKKYYSRMGFSRLLYKVVPAFYHRIPAQDDLYALFRSNAKLSRRDISSTIDLFNRYPMSQRRKRSLKKAIQSGVMISSDLDLLPDFWEIVTENLSSKHGVRPTHSLGEINLLARKFPEEIKCVCGYLEGQMVAGTLLFSTATSYHAQYIAASPLGNKVSALDMVFDYAIKSAKQNGKRWFDFGISTESGGMVLNEGLFGFKTEFGSGSMTHEFYELELT